MTRRQTGWLTRYRSGGTCGGHATALGRGLRPASGTTTSRC
jgi:hypothetical protein